MKVFNVEQRTDAWEELRKGRITGTRLNDIIVKRGSGRKIGFYELLADRLVTSDGYEEIDPMERGASLEDAALEAFTKHTKKEVEKIGFCTSDKNERIALSPDGLIKVNGKYTEAVEIKCLSSARHLQAYFEQKLEPEYEMQAMQYFIVNDDLEVLHFVLFDPRITALPMHIIDFKREDYADKIEEYREYQENVLKEVDDLFIKLSF